MSGEEPAHPGTLWIVATPIGHLDDITLRALQVLREADLILAEDTRRTGVLLEHHGVGGPMRSFHAHTKDAGVAELVERLAGGQTLALVSDAGTPLISDPGVRLVAAAREAGIPVTTAPGVSAVPAALSIAGLRTDRFTFHGFLPRSAGKRRRAVEAIAERPEASVLFEAPTRIGSLLELLAERCPERRVAVCRELTKRFEEVVRGTPREVAERFADGARGEITLVVEAQEDTGPQMAEGAVEAFVRQELARGAKVKAVAKALADRSQLSRSDAYQRVLDLREALPPAEGAEPDPEG